MAASANHEPVAVTDSIAATGLANRPVAPQRASLVGMHVIGARFGHLEPAIAALGEIRARLAAGSGDVALRRLGSTRYEAPEDGFVLAGRFAPEDVDPVVSAVERFGGVVIARRVERPKLSLTRGGAAQAAPASALRTVRSRLSRLVRARNRRPAAFLHSRAAWERRLRA